MKKRIALLLCLVMLVSVFSGCSLVLGGFAIIISKLETTEPTEIPTEDPTEFTSPQLGTLEVFA